MNLLLQGPILPTLLRLAAPNTMAIGATAMVAIAETAYVSVLGIAPLAAMALVFPMVMLQGMMSTGAMGGGVSSAVSRALGANDLIKAQSLARHAAMIGTLGGLLFMCIFLTQGDRIFAALGGKGDALTQALLYASVVFLGSIPVWLVNTFVSVIRGSGNMKIPSATLLVICALQVVLGGVLGLGFGSFSGWGIRGVALGQVLANLAALCFLLWYLIRGNARVRLKVFEGQFSVAMFKDILKVGALACISPMLSVLTVLIVTRMVAHYGTESLAGYGIGARLEFLLVPITFGIGSACVPMVGMAIGAGQIARARKVAWTGGMISAVLLGAVGIFFALFPQLWVSHFTQDPQASAIASSYLNWAGPCYGVFGLGLCLYFAAMGSGKILGPVLAAGIRFLVVAIGGWLLLRAQAPAWAMFALVGASMVAYGAATALSIHWTRWGPKTLGS